MKSRSSESEGFSLVEVLIAISILTFGLLAAAQLLTMTIILDAKSRSKSTASLAAQNEIERLADLYRRNPDAEELIIGTHQAEELTEIRNPLNQNVLNRYKITWLVDGIPALHPGINAQGRIISVRATPMLTENLENTDSSKNKAVTLNTVIAAEP